MWKYVYLIIHGEIFDQVPDSGLTSIGIKNTALLKNDIPKKPSYVLCGTGNRHLQTAKLLGLTINQYSDIIETGAIPAKVLDRKLCILPKGDIISHDKYYENCNFEKKCLEDMILSLPDNAVVIGGPSTARRLYFHPAPPSSVYIMRINPLSEEVGPLNEKVELFTEKIEIAQAIFYAV